MSLGLVNRQMRLGSSASNPQVFVASRGLYILPPAFPGMVDSILQEQHVIEQCPIILWDVLEHQDYSLLPITP